MSPRALLLPLLLALAPGCHTRGLFKGLSYPDSVTPVPGQDRYRILAMELRAVVLADYDAPATATACLDRAVRQDPTVRTTLMRHAACVAGDPSACPGRGEGAAWSHVDALSAALVDACTLGDADRVRVVDAVLTAAEVGGRWLESDLGRPFRYQRVPEVGTSCNLASGAANEAYELLCAVEAATGGAASLAAVTDDVGRGELPALVLSGGSANGAFSAGYVYELLRLRERGLSWVPPRELADAQASASFSAVVSTSVGTLVALPVDRYFAADALTDLAKAREGRRWALETLRRRFIAEEGDLLCARRFRVGELWSGLFGRRRSGQEPVDSLLEFQPMEAMVREEMFPDEAQAEALVRTGPVRVSLAVDARTTLTAVADERACDPARLPSKDALIDCLVKQVMASITLPIFARAIEGDLAMGLPDPPVGVPGRGGPGGLFFDGGVKSGTPAVSALSYTRGRVLAVSNHRLSGAPKLELDNAFGLAFRSIDLFTDVVREREIEQAGLLLRDRERRRVELAARMRVSWLAPAPDRVYSAHIPSVVPAEIGAEGYTFDPEVMIALFRWGQWSLLRNAPEVLGHLGGGWARIGAAPQLADEVERRLRFVEADIAARDNGWTDTSWRAAHQVRRAASFPDHVQLCPRNERNPPLRPVTDLSADPTFVPEEGESLEWWE